MDGRAYRISFALLVAAHVALVWTLPVLPGQDLPQHLAYARILADHASSALFRDTYQVVEPFQTYFTTHYLLAAMEPWLGVLGGLRVLLTAHVLATFLGFQMLVGAFHPRTRAPGWTALLAAIFVWNPALCMGFLPFALAVPWILVGAASLVRVAEEGGRRPLVSLAGSTMLASCLHPLATACLLFFAVAYVAASPSRRRAAAAAWLTAAGLFVVGFTAVVGETGVHAERSPDVAEAVRAAHGLEAVDRVLGITWTELPVRLNYVLWALLGPFRFDALAVLGLCAIALGIVVGRARVDVADASPSPSSARRAVGIFAVASWLSPWAVRLGGELTFLDLRLLGIAVPLGLALVDPARLRTVAYRAAIAAACAMWTLHFAVRAFGFAGEARAPLDLLARARPVGVLQSLVLHGESSHFGETFRMTHFLPTYYTTLEGGVATQFWARYTPHLPVGYRPGRQPPQAPDWIPRRFRPESLDGSDHLLVQWATADDPLPTRRTSERIRRSLRDVVEPAGCEGGWCLYRVRREPADARVSLAEATFVPD
jgi:hypothetical protein